MTFHIACLNPSFISEVSKMFVVDTHYPTARPFPWTPRKAEPASQVLLHALRALYRATRVMEASYEKAILRMHTLRCSSLESLFEKHLSEQRELLDALEERLSCVAGDSSQCSHALLYASSFPAARVLRQTRIGILESLKTRHDWLLHAAAPSPRLGARAAAWAQDISVGRFVLSNDLQRVALIEELQRCVIHYRFNDEHHVGEM
jgi:hypothetical protein